MVFTNCVAILFVSGDFDVPSSREDVDRDSMWNQWLMSEIHTLFIESFEAFKVCIILTHFTQLYCRKLWACIQDSCIGFIIS